MTRWHLHPDYAQTAAARCFSTLPATFAVTGECITRDKVSEVVRAEIGGTRYYVKRYRGVGAKLRRIVGSARAESEWANLHRFADWGIPTATVVAHGQERRMGVFMRGAMVTEEIAGTEDLLRLARTGHPMLRNPRAFRAVSQQVAAIVRTLHSHRFTHNDLHWRNLLLQASSGKVFLIDCPNGTFWRGPLLAYRIIKDLASLDKLARTYLSRTRRLRFYLDYVAHERLTARDKRFVRRILFAYRRRLWRKRLGL